MHESVVKAGYHLNSGTIDGNRVLQEIKKLKNGKFGTENILNAEELQLVYNAPAAKKYPIKVEEPASKATENKIKQLIKRFLQARTGLVAKFPKKG